MAVVDPNCRAVVTAATQRQTAEQPPPGSAEVRTTPGVAEDGMGSTPGVLFYDARPLCRADDFAAIAAKSGVSAVVQNQPNRVVAERFTLRCHKPRGGQVAANSGQRAVRQQAVVGAAHRLRFVVADCHSVPLVTERS